jgi:GNAT superfamily N-acetyltransferase
VELTQVLTPRERREFLSFPWRVYAGDPLWVPPLLAERAKVIDPARGPFFRRGTAEFFIARRGGAPVGTICAAEERTLNERTGVHECMFGFFEALDEEAARALFDHAERWAAGRGLTHLAGPINLDPEDSYGVLVEGRDRPPAILCGHSPPSYQGYFERAGFTPLRPDNIAFEMRLDQESQALARTAVMAERIRKRGWIRLRTPDMARWKDEAAVVHELLNKALAHLVDFRPYERETVEAMVEPFKSIADPDLILFAEIDGKTIGWFPGIPNMNEVLIHLDGLRHPWDYLRALRWMRMKPRCLAVKSVLILPEYWGSGAALLLIDEMARRGRAKGYEWVDLSLTSDDNPYTPGLARRMGARIYKRYRTYRRDVR